MSFLVIGQHYWGHGEDLATAKKNFKLKGGSLSEGYTIMEFGPDQEFTGVDMLGRVHWNNGDTEPLSTKEVKPR